MTSLKLTEYQSTAALPLIVRRRTSDHAEAGHGEATTRQHQADLFKMAREIYLRAQVRRRVARAEGRI